MALEVGNFNLFGLDLGRGWREFRQGCADALNWPGLAWLSPQEPVRLLRPDGSIEWRMGLSARPAPAGAASAAQAILLPDDVVLFRDVVVPNLVDPVLREALALQVGEQSPFVPEELVWGWRASPREDGRLDVRLALTSRAYVGQHLASIGVQADDRVEIWADGAAPVLIRGFGEAARERRTLGQRKLAFAALGLLAVSLLALAATPFMLKREQVFDAQARYAALVDETAQAVADREALLKASTRLTAIKTHLEGQVNLPRLLDALTRVVPDSAHLTRLEVTGRQVRIGGIAANAAALIEALGALPEIRDVRTPSAISRSSDGRESFAVEFAFVDAELAR